MEPCSIEPVPQHVEVEISVTAQPLALVDAHFGDVALILSAHESFKTHGMAEGPISGLSRLIGSRCCLVLT